MARESLAVYGHAVCAYVVIMVLSLSCALGICPLFQHELGEILISFLVALAVSCLTGDAIFHLLPHALAQSDEDSSADPHTHATLLKSLAVVCSIYFFYLFHAFSGIAQGGHGHSHSCKSLSRHSLEGVKEEVSLEDECSKSAENLPDSGDSKSSPAKSAVPTIASMLLVSCAFHCFNDGLAIGAAFSKGVSDGISTSIAVACHEIPHEIGDFAIMIRSGLSIKKTFCLKLLTRVSSLVGVVVGVALGREIRLTKWIFAVTAGMFLFIAMVEMLPEMLNASIKNKERRNKKVIFIVENLGLIIGYVIMILIMLYESKRHGKS